MKNSINTKLFLILLAACIVATVMVLPYTLTLSPALAQIFTPVVLIAQVVQSAVLFSIAIFLGYAWPSGSGLIYQS